MNRFTFGFVVGALVALSLSLPGSASATDYRGKAIPPDCAILYTFSPGRRTFTIVGHREINRSVVEYAISYGQSRILTATAYYLDTEVWLLKWTWPGDSSRQLIQRIVESPWSFIEIKTAGWYKGLTPDKKAAACREFYTRVVSPANCGITWEQFKDVECN